MHCSSRTPYNATVCLGSMTSCMRQTMQVLNLKSGGQLLLLSAHVCLPLHLLLLQSLPVCLHTWAPQSSPMPNIQAMPPAGQAALLSDRP